MDRRSAAILLFLTAGTAGAKEISQRAYSQVNALAAGRPLAAGYDGTPERAAISLPAAGAATQINSALSASRRAAFANDDRPSALGPVAAIATSLRRGAADPAADDFLNDRRVGGAIGALAGAAAGLMIAFFLSKILY